MSGTVFALTFTFTALVVGFTADKISKSSFGRHRLMAIGVLVFSTSCLLTGFSSAYWHLVILRVGIAAGEEKNLLIYEDNRWFSSKTEYLFSGKKSQTLGDSKLIGHSDLVPKFSKIIET